MTAKMLLKKLLLLESSVPKDKFAPGFRLPFNATPVEFTSWEAREAAAEATSTIDYGCQFDGKTCIDTRAYGGKHACCGGCSADYHQGQLDAIPVGSAKYFASLWDEARGFLGPQGCKIPRRWRSVSCLTWTCHSVKPVTAKLIQINLLKAC